MYPYQHDAERKMTALATRYSDPSKTETRILNQLARELLLAQSSDWAFQIYQGTTVGYSSRRFQSHIHRFDLLMKMLDEGSVDIDLLSQIERRDTIFPEIDYRIYAARP
ncbi:MAG: 1,4-alpha-glucan branching protein domain-containing protein, partial [Pyrinomonadaceae bacterium]